MCRSRVCGATPPGRLFILVNSILFFSPTSPLSFTTEHAWGWLPLGRAMRPRQEISFNVHGHFPRLIPAEHGKCLSSFLSPSLCFRVRSLVGWLSGWLVDWFVGGLVIGWLLFLFLRRQSQHTTDLEGRERRGQEKRWTVYLERTRKCH